MMILAVGTLWFLFHKSQAPTSQQQNSLTNAVAAVNSTTSIPVSNSIPNQPPVATVVTNISSDEADVTAKYKQSLIGKDAAVTEIMMLKNKQSQDFYGKAVDQYGQPIAGVDVTGNLMLIQGWDKDEKITRYKTQSDENGLFQFTGLTGWQLGVTVNKVGYLMGNDAESFKTPAGGKTSPNDRAIITMWKLRGPETLVGQSIDAKISHDGTSATFDMGTGKESPSGDLRVTLSRFPLEVHRGRDRFDWVVKIEMLHGGLIEENDPYPYWAPETGYQRSFEFNVSSNSVPWQYKLEQSFYIKNSQGQYGKMQFGIYSALTPSRLQVGLTINPSGSQNLEPAFEK